MIATHIARDLRLILTTSPYGDLKKLRPPSDLLPELHQLIHLLETTDRDSPRLIAIGAARMLLWAARCSHVPPSALTSRLLSQRGTPPLEPPASADPTEAPSESA